MLIGGYEETGMVSPVLEQPTSKLLESFLFGFGCQSEGFWLAWEAGNRLIRVTGCRV